MTTITEVMTPFSVPSSSTSSAPVAPSTQLESSLAERVVDIRSLPGPVKMGPKRQRRELAATASLSGSFPSRLQPQPGAGQFSHSGAAKPSAAVVAHAARVLAVDRSLKPYPSHNNHPNILSPVHTNITFQEEDNVAIYGSHSFAYYSGIRTDLGVSGLHDWQDGSPNSLRSISFYNCDKYEDRIYPVPLLIPIPAQRLLTPKTTFLSPGDDDDDDDDDNDDDDKMTSTTSPPNSPPDLSASKSSKSSSLQSSQLGPTDGVAKDIANFEEIALDEPLHHDAAHQGTWDQKDTAMKSPSPVSSIGAQPEQPARRPPTNKSTTRPMYPSLQGQVEGTFRDRRPKHPALFTKSSGAIGSVKRRLSRASTASLPTPVPRPSQPRTRSSSPTPKPTTPATFASGAGHNLTLGSRSTGIRPPNRRQSWQSSRKSIKQLEAEYRDSDDELPDDASLWNVPMSPRPPIARSPSARSSRCGSSERESFPDGQRFAPISPGFPPPPPAPSSPRHAISRSSRNPPPPRTSSLQIGRSTASPTSPNFRAGFRDHRAKSWTMAMADLSEEARVLTENLEIHHDIRGRQHEENVQNGIIASRPSVEFDLGRSARSSAVELPPIQRGNILIDPMPLSKEKEAVLTRTRPSWLPPKDPKEERRHVKEYQRMMAASLEAERKKEARTTARQCDKDDTREALNRIWEQYVYPEWDRVTHEHRTRELWWRGVSPKLRGQVWMRAIGNPLALTHRSYSIALQRIMGLRAKPITHRNDNERAMLTWVSNVERDTQYTFPELNLFQRDRGLWQELVNVCCAYVSYRSDVGYRYEFQLIAAVMLLQLPSAADVFVLLANCLNGPLALAFLTNDLKPTARIFDQVSSSLLYKTPRLYRHLFAADEDGGLGMDFADTFTVILRALLANGLDIERLVRVWDCYVFEGEKVIVRATVALLSCLQTHIFGFEGTSSEKRRKVWELLSWGPLGRVRGRWDLQGDADSFMAEVKEAGKFNVEDESGRIH